MTVGLLTTRLAAAQGGSEVEFNADFLKTPVDLRLFARGNPVSPGLHRVELFVNGEWRGRRDLMFVLPASGQQVAQPCFDAELLGALGIATGESGVGGGGPSAAQQDCSLLQALVPGALARHDPARQQLDVQVPQAVLRRRGAERDPSTWDQGIPAATLQYDYSGFRAESAGTRPYASHHLGLRSGFTWGRWRGRLVGGLSTGGKALHYTSQAAQLETALPGWSSRLLLGDATTEGQVFEGLNLRGLQLGSDARMLPDAQRVLSPKVRGVARSNALVAVRQRQGLVYQVAVPPGPFVLEDLPVSPHGGDLQVTVTEADGEQQGFTVPHSPAPQALPPGQVLYNLAWGAYQAPGRAFGPGVALATAHQGVSDRTTVFGGLLAAAGYQAASAGLALNTGWGALCFAWTHARMQQPGGALQAGERLSFQHAKFLPGGQTSLSLSGQWDAGRGFVGPSRALAQLADERATTGAPWLEAVPSSEPRARMWLSASRSLGRGWGAVAVMASAQWRWNAPGPETDVLFSYARQAGPLAYGLNVAHTARMPAEARRPLQVSLNLSMPLDRVALRPRWASTASGGKGATVFNTSLAGTLDKAQALSYTTYLASQGGGQGIHGTASRRTHAGGALLNWAAPRTQLGASVSAGSGGAQQYSASASGGLVLYAGGLVWARELGETLAIVEAPHAGGARVAGWEGRLDTQGRGVVPHLMPYRSNEAGVDPQGLPLGVGVVGSSRKVIPTSGAVVLLRIDTETGHPLLASGRLADGRPLPFGARVRDAAGRGLGHVAQGGQALLRLAEPRGRLMVEWGEAPGERCSFDYAVPPEGVQRALRAAGVALPHVDVLCL